MSSCEEIGLDLRKLEFTIDQKMIQVESFDTRKVDYAVVWDRSDVLDFFDISDDADIKQFWIRNFKVYYVPCAENEATQLDLEIYLSEPGGALTGLAFINGKDLKNIKTKVDPTKPYDINLGTFYKGNDVNADTPGPGIDLLNNIVGAMISDNTGSAIVNIIVSANHHPAGALVCGDILIVVDAYIVYEECRLVPFGSEAGNPCE
jgi:hypothetical protein